MGRRGWIGLVLFAMLIWKCAGIFPRTVDGLVVDNDTGEPVPNAHISIIWWTKPFPQMDGGFKFLRASEAVTDAEGRFTVSAASGVEPNPLRVVQTPLAWVAAPGYTIGYMTYSTSNSWTWLDRIPLSRCPVQRDVHPPGYEFPLSEHFCGRLRQSECVAPDAVQDFYRALTDVSNPPCFKTLKRPN
jgi:hypothetical protein